MKTNTFATMLAALATVAVSQTLPPNCARTYTVQPGDWCDKISADQSVSTYQLSQVNTGIINAECTNLWVGQTICLGITGEDCTATHVVESGDTCSVIADAAGITFADILANNPNVDAECTNIYPGEVLCVAPVSP